MMTNDALALHLTAGGPRRSPRQRRTKSRSSRAARHSQQALCVAITLGLLHTVIGRCAPAFVARAHAGLDPGDARSSFRFEARSGLRPSGQPTLRPMRLSAAPADPALDPGMPGGTPIRPPSRALSVRSQRLLAFDPPSGIVET